MEENMSNKASSDVDNVSTEGLYSNGGCYPAYPNKHLGHCSKESVNKFQGIMLMPEQNGNWGSQMYANGHQIWPVTVKSEEEPEMMAYDHAATVSYWTSPWINVIVKEPNFQSQYGQEAVLEMIRGASCQPRFRGLHGNNYGNTESGICGLNVSAMQNRGGLSHKLLFRKMLTPSDVGRLNRLVIPKKYATTCFPEISRRMEEYAKAGIRADHEQVDFFDRMMTSWKFRYCYWKSSQSYVFTRGWIKFVKENHLKVNDAVAFYSCEFQREGKIVNKFFMIDPERGENYGSSSRNRSVIEVANDHYQNIGLKSEMGCSVFEGGSYHHHHHDVEVKSEVCSHNDDDDDDDKRLGKQVMMDVDPPSNVETKGFRLFGVQIN